MTSIARALRKSLLTALLAAFSFSALAQDVQVHNLADDFATTWDATKDLPMAERVEAFKKNVASKFPEFYAPDRRGGVARQDALIADQIEKFGAIREAYLGKVRAFGSAMPRHLAAFQVAFPDFRLTTPTYLVHSLYEMDGGTRTLNGKTYLIFGADLMAILHPDEDDAALFLHELFHVYHTALFNCSSDSMWTSLWEEGLAVYVSEKLSHRTSLTELLLDFPKGMPAATQARLPEAWAQLEQMLDSTSPDTYAEFFNTAQTEGGLPARRGYYLGYLVAQEAGQTRGLTTLAHLTCDQVEPLVKAIVHQKILETRANSAR
jgi:hypothetical protein